jgi:exodeoxyribonuclease VIII
MEQGSTKDSTEHRAAGKQLDPEDPQPGIYFDVPDHVYRSIRAFNKSGIHYLLKSPAKYKWYLENSSFESTEATVMGNLVETLLFEPEHFSKRFAVRPERSQKGDGSWSEKWMSNSNYARKWDREQKEQGLMSICKSYRGPKMASLELAERMLPKLKENPTVQEFMQHSKYQGVCIWVDEEHGVLCKGMFDGLCVTPESFFTIWDLKTTFDAAPSQFRWTAKNYNYHVQGAMYVDGYKYNEGIHPKYIIVAAEKMRDLDVAAYDMSIESFENGRALYKAAMKIYADCQAREYWPGYSQYPEPLDVPESYIPDSIEEEEL